MASHDGNRIKRSMFGMLLVETLKTLVGDDKVVRLVFLL